LGGGVLGVGFIWGGGFRWCFLVFFLGLGGGVWVSRGGGCSVWVFHLWGVVGVFYTPIRRVPPSFHFSFLLPPSGIRRFPFLSPLNICLIHWDSHPWILVIFFVNPYAAGRKISKPTRTLPLTISFPFLVLHLSVNLSVVKCHSMFRKLHSLPD